MPSLRGAELGETIVERAPTENAANAAPERGNLIGRFVVLEVLGTGGMGVVYAAYDPQLDRKVAIKVLRAQVAGSEEARVRLLREAQAMARIDHPNVLRVHEAGTLGEQIFIAMEFAGGGTLRQWLAEQPRDRRDILALFAHAGRGLAAAHAAGLVHRDFKPDNVLLVGDGRARVTDFGIVGVVGEMPAARPSGDLDKPLSENTPLSRDLTRTGAVMGTPAYMSPEQFQGGTVGPEADQFSFCVALYEALYHTRPFAGRTFHELCASVIGGKLTPIPREADVPSRIRRALLRGLATDPKRRYPSMDRLLGDLLPGEGGKRRAIVAASAAGVLAIGAVGVFALRSDPNVCSGGDARLAAVWGPAQQQKVSAAFAAANRPDAKDVLARVVPIVDRWGQGWQQAYVGACEDTRVRKVQSEHQLDLRMDCLGRRLDETRATLEALAAGGGDAVDHAIEAVRGLPSVAACADSDALAKGIEPPATAEARVAVAAIRGKLDQARAQRKLARYADAMKLATGALEDARASRYDPVIAEALLELGTLKAKVADLSAPDTLGEAMVTATSAGHSDVAIRAAAARITALSRQPSRFPVADEIGRIAAALAAHASPSAETRVELEDAAGLLLQKEGKRDDAKAHYEKALQIATTQLGPDAPATLVTLQSMGSLAAERHKFDEARKLFEQVLAAQERIAGPTHPDYATALENLANVDSETGKVTETKQARERALAIRLAALGPDHPDVAKSYDHLGGFYEETGDHAQAKAYLEKALAVYQKAYGEETVEQTTTMQNLGLVLSGMGDHDAARAILERARALREKAYGDDDVRVAVVLSTLGIVAKEQRRFDDAIALFQRAQKLDEKAFGANDPDALDQLGNIASTYTLAGRLPEARETTSTLLSEMAAIYGPDNPRIGLGYGNYGFLQMQLDDPKGAFASFQKAQQIFEAKLGKNHPNVAFVLIGESQALIKLKREAEAVPLLERALQIGTAAHIAPAQLAETHFYYAMALVANPANRQKARAEMTAAMTGYHGCKHDKDAALAKKWLQKH
ncbi:MAG: tetratricopeptide repeat protein [Acidobacteriota bacterium]